MTAKRAQELVAAGGGALAGLGALVGASCCLLPILLINLGVGSAFVANLVFFARAKPYFMVAAIVLLLAGLMVAFWRRRRPSPIVLGLFALAVVFLIAAYDLPYYEGEILRWTSLR
jgi:mercuric ion transport protein